MIVQALQAQNFRQFLHLNIQLIPANGVILLVGGNETGKSAIGEAIVFALFGLSDRVGAKTLHQLIRWGQEEAIVQLAFQINDKALLIERTISTAGQMSVVLWDRSTGQVIADAIQQVQTVLQNLLGYGHKVFNQTFYWSQRLTKSSTADLEAIQAMAGVQVYQQVHDLIENDTRTALSKSEQLEKTLQEQAAQLKQRKVDPLRLKWLQETQAELSNSQEQHYALAEQIGEETQHYERRYPLYHQIKRQVSSLHWGAGLLLLLMLILLGGSLSSGFTLWVESLWTGASKLMIWIALLLGISAAVAVFFAYRLANEEMTPLRSKVGLLAQRLYTGYRMMSVSLHELLHPATADWLREKQIAPESADMLMDMQSLAKWSNRVENYAIEPTDLRHLADGLVVNLQQRQQMTAGLLSRANEDIYREQTKAQEAQAIQQQQLERQTVLGAAQTQLQVQIMAQGLLNRAHHQAAVRFNGAINHSTRAYIEAMTGGEYQGVELADDLQLYVIQESNQSRTPFKTLKAEVQREIAMALRLSLAKALALRHGTNQHSLFWDEALLSFTEPLLSQALAHLNTLAHQSTTQLWVSLPQIPENGKDLVLLDCRPDDNVLDIRPIRLGTA
ncbi:AAA family ATPase [Thiofilum flexile]|uniref:AAA family ATPase n=1 Tax=Thiofilum flexile TaxID=125627 RepID=UPI0003606EDD|nr:AAA family ATPase [Thiofilum flexile]